jgi:hypothetical protein
MRVNVGARVEAVTHEGGRAAPRIDALAQLERQVATCLLWEPTFYEKGEDIAASIAAGVAEVVAKEPKAIADLAVRARTEFKLRHVPLFLVRELARYPEGRPFVADALAEVVRRPDELAEFLAIYSQGRTGRKVLGKLSHQAMKGLARAFRRFNAYQLGKWNRDRAIKLRDVLFLVHAKPKDEEQAATWKQLVDGTLPIPDTWEVALSGGADKRATWERLVSERKLGIMALLMNCRNMVEAGCSLPLVGKAIREQAEGSWALPFRFLQAAKYAPALADALSDGLLKAASGMERLPGKTAVIVDVSGSMDVPISKKSQLTRWEAAAALAILCRELMDDCRVFTFSSHAVEIPNLRGLSLSTAIGASQPHSGTQLLGAIETLIPHSKPDRVVVITDEQSHDGIPALIGMKGYLINVAPYAPGLSVEGGWARINGWSERCLDWMRWHEGGRMTVADEEES